MNMKIACMIRQAIAKPDLQNIAGPRAQHGWQIGAVVKTSWKSDVVAQINGPGRGGNRCVQHASTTSDLLRLADQLRRRRGWAPELHSRKRWRRPQHTCESKGAEAT